MANTHPTPASGPNGVRAWLREVPYLATLLLTLGGVAYSALSRSPLQHYWELVTLFNCGACIYEGWGVDGQRRWRVVWTQLLHWGAFLVAMTLLFLPSVQAVANADSTGLAILLLLALGTFVAGVHTASWRVGLNGVVLALCVPVVAWLDQSALIVTLAVLALLLAAALLAGFWLRRRM
ncbi:hypothetical protein J5J86_22870 [Aquabacter sp. L1I39]|uniref:hypothetical protein n=1 Tax=Aquabacter sp. L1I39 TaxID=2820278 RepID=UPI001ADC472E|nr:hypothetical protein [Aquabacter sp. L1I39]QTL03535.1 hypothetical protein J5J86_22870 [Aquabacter sp. L1I39]